MEEFVIVSDSACDLTQQEIEENGLKVVPFYISFDGQNYYKEREEIGVREFYERMVANPTVFPKTSTPSVQDYVNVYEQIIKEGKTVLCLCLTSKMSGSFNTANTARTMVLEDNKDAKIIIIDSEVITVLQGILVLEVCRMKRNGLSLEETIAQIKKVIPTGRIYFTIANVDYLKHGGRIGKLSGMIGSALRLKPIINFRDGEIFSGGIALTRMKALQGVIDLLKKHFETTGEQVKDYFFSLGYGYSFEEGSEFRDRLVTFLKEKFNDAKVSLYQIGATISVHTGPHPVGLGFLKKYDA